MTPDIRFSRAFCKELASAELGLYSTNDVDVYPGKAHVCICSVKVKLRTDLKEGYGPCEEALLCLVLDTGTPSKKCAILRSLTLAIVFDKKLVFCLPLEMGPTRENTAAAHAPCAANR